MKLTSESQTPDTPYLKGRFDDACLNKVGHALCVIGAVMQNPDVKVAVDDRHLLRTIAWVIGQFRLKGVCHNLDAVWYSPAAYDRATK